MKKSVAGLLGAAAIAAMVAAPATEASAWWRGGWGWGPSVAVGVLGGAAIAGAIIASRPPGYVFYPGYAEPLYAPGCYWASRPVYDGGGRVVGYTGQPMQVCPGYSGPPPDGPGAPPPGYAGGPQNYAGGPPAGSPIASCVQRFRSYDPNTGTYLGNDGKRHPCP